MEQIELTIWFKEEKGYRKAVIKPEFNTNSEYFRSLRLKIEIEIDKIKQHILSLFNDPELVNLKKPIHQDEEKQTIIDKLVLIKRDNIRAREIVKGILADEEFIICERCRSKMYKIPINVSYSKYGNSYLIHDNINLSDVKYIYGCSKEDCYCCILEDEYIQMMRWINLRDELLKKGETFVPNKFGQWNHIN